MGKAADPDLATAGLNWSIGRGRPVKPPEAAEDLALRAWARTAEAETAGAGARLYTRQDTTHVAPGLPGAFPYTRGVHASMYAGRPWTIRQYAGFSTAEETNAFFRQCLAEGQRGLSVAFDLPTHRGYDSDDPRVAGEVGLAGVAIDTAEDMTALFDGVPLAETSVSMTMNGAVLPCLAFFIVAAEDQGVAPAALQGTIQNDILKEFIVRNTYIYPPAPSMRLVVDVMDYAARHMPRFNPISVSGYHLHEAGATPVQELAYALANGLAYIRAARTAGLPIDALARRMSFFFAVGMDLFGEVAKLRAARTLWAKLLAAEGVTDPRALMLRTHCQTSGVSLAGQEPHNNIVRTTVEALAAVLGGTQSLHTNAFDEALALPGDAAARLARNTQLILEHETGLADIVDPLGGSYYVEALTRDFEEAARAQIEAIEARGGMLAAVAEGDPSREIAEAAALKQARLDSGQSKVVGVNLHRSPDADAVTVRRLDSDATLRAQRQRLAAVKGRRDADRVCTALTALRDGARGEANLMDLAVQAARARCTLGEISQALGDVFGRHSAALDAPRRIYGPAVAANAQAQTAQRQVAAFSAARGRAPKVLVAKLGQDGHDRGAKTVAGGLADLGFEVVMGDLFQSSAEVARLAVHERVDILGVSILSGAHRALMPEVLAELSRLSFDGRVVLGGIIPVGDHAALRRDGVSQLFGPGDSLLDIAPALLRLLGWNPD